jgi:ParB-like chromosome segregation protein Spo0J
VLIDGGIRPSPRARHGLASDQLPDLSLPDPAKVEKAIERARRLGQITPPIRVRRIEDSSQLIDGLYRLRAAEALGWEQVPGVIE